MFKAFPDSIMINIPFIPPSNLAFTNISPTKIKLDWTGNNLFEKGFIIERHERGSGYTIIDQTSANIFSFSDNQLDTSKDYFYRISSFSSYNKSKPSDEIILGYYPGDQPEKYVNNVYGGGFLPYIPSPDGKYLFFGGHFVNDPDESYGHFKIYNNITKSYENSGVHGTKLLMAAFSTNSKLLATFSDDGFIKIWNNSALTIYNEIACSTQINNMIFSGDNNKLICASTDNKIYCWDINNGSLLYTNNNNYIQKIESFALSPDGETIACASGNKVELFAASSGEIIYTFPLFQSNIGILKYSSNNLLAIMSGGNRY